MRVLNLHSWEISTTEAGALQRDLATRVVRSRCFSFQPRHVAGVDVSVDRVHGTARAAVVVLSYPALLPVEVQTVGGWSGVAVRARIPLLSGGSADSVCVPGVDSRS